MKLMRVLRVACLGAVLVAAVLACNNSPSSPTGAAFSSTDLQVGTGTVAANGLYVKVGYTGWLYDSTKTDAKGLQFDSNSSLTPFTLGSGSVIAGWDQGLVGMKVGGIRRLVIPPSLGYGGSRYGIIPPNSTLVFDISLLNVCTTSTC